MQTHFIDKVSTLRAYLDAVALPKIGSPLLFVDLEGNNLSSHGTLSLITILDDADHTVTTLIDVTVLGRDAFVESSSSGRTLKDIFESSSITKVFFDVRCDSNALFGLYDVSLKGVEDLQLMELASRTFSRRCVNGLAKCIEKDASISPFEQQKWRKVKDKGQTLFNPIRGGTFAVFDERPLHSDVMEYCVQDVAFMPHLRQIYRDKLCDSWWEKILDESKARVSLSQTPQFNGQGRHMAEGPPAWISWHPTPTQKLEKSFLQRSATPEPQRSSDKPADLSLLPTDRLTSFQKAFQRLELDDEDSDAGFEATLGGGDYFDSDRDDRDFTACDKECGYCGRCDY